MPAGPPSHPEGRCLCVGQRWDPTRGACPHVPREIFEFWVWQPPSPGRYLAGVNPPGQVPGTEHGTGEQVPAQGAPACLLAEQGHLRLHHHVGCRTLCQARHPLRGPPCPGTPLSFASPCPGLVHQHWALERSPGGCSIDPHGCRGGTYLHRGTPSPRCSRRCLGWALWGRWAGTRD